MNKRIEEFMLEATKDMPDAYYWPGPYVEKFAELIVKKCADVAYYAHWSDPERVKGQYIKEKVKEHFGI